VSGAAAKPPPGHTAAASSTRANRPEGPDLG
jgi:hypothetical protein